MPSFRLHAITGAPTAAPNVAQVHIGSCNFFTDNPFYGKHDNSKDDVKGVDRPISHLVLQYLAAALIRAKLQPASCGARRNAVHTGALTVPSLT